MNSPTDTPQDQAQADEVRTRCHKGHDLTPENTRVLKSGRRDCKKCRLAWSRASRDKLMFGGNRENAIARDGGRCVNCGVTREEHFIKYKGKDITVDHIDGAGSRSPVHLKNNDLTNLQTLCITCHAGKDNRYKKLTSAQVVNIRHMRDCVSAREASRLYGVTAMHVRDLRRGNWWKTENLTLGLAELSQETVKEHRPKLHTVCPKCLGHDGHKPGCKDWGMS